MKRLIALVLVSLSLGCASKTVVIGGPGGEEVAREQTIPLIGDYQVHRFQLDNGLRLLVVEDHSSPTFAYQTWFRVGSRDEQVGFTGLAHLFEHMMFKETKNLAEGEFDKLLERAGAEGENAFTSRDYTAYVQEMPKEHLELIARLEADRMVNLVVNEKAFRTEAEVVQNERRQRTENNPDGLMYQEIFLTAFKKHPYQWPVIGYQADLDRMTSKEALEFYKAFYSPNHATIVVVGDVKPKQVLSVIEKYYGEIPAQASPARMIEAEPPQTAPRRKQLKLNVQVEKLMMGYHIPDVKHEDIPTLRVAAALLAGGKSSRLYRGLVDTGVATSIDAYELENKDPSIFVFGSNLQKGRRAAEAEAIILREVARLAKVPPSEQELERAKNRINFAFYDALTSNYEKAQFLGSYEALANDFRNGLEQQKRVGTVNALEVQAVVKRYLDPRNRSVVTGVKK